MESTMFPFDFGFTPPTFEPTTFMPPGMGGLQPSPLGDVLTPPPPPGVPNTPITMSGATPAQVPAPPPAPSPPGGSFFDPTNVQTPMGVPPVPGAMPTIPGSLFPTPTPMVQPSAGTPAPGIPLPRPRPTPGVMSSIARPEGDQTTAKPGQGGPDKLLQALRGIQAPKPPDVVKPSTPALPKPTPIQAGQLFALLQSLGQPNAVQNSINPTLLQAIGGR